MKLVIDQNWDDCKPTFRKSGKRLPQHIQALGDAGPGVFPAFEFQRDIPAEIVFSQHAGDTGVVEVQLIP